jgi:hypothetical protein
MNNEISFTYLGSLNFLNEGLRLFVLPINYERMDRICTSIMDGQLLESASFEEDEDQYELVIQQLKEYV